MSIRVKHPVLPILVAGLTAAGCGASPDAVSQDPTRSGALRAAGPRSSTAWETVVDNATAIPGAGARTFASYSQPSVNGRGLVAFRARSGGVGGGETAAATGGGGGGGGGGGLVRGVFTRDLASRASPGPVVSLARTGDLVPQPNNTASTFTEFPSIPRIDLMSPVVATRAQSRPTWNYVVDAAGNTTRVGTSSIFANLSGGLVPAVDLLGAVTDVASGQPVFPQFAVPGALPGTRFDQFPGATGVAGALPGVAGSTAVIFKGNWTDLADPLHPVSRTGVYFRDVSRPENPVVRIADSMRTLIPGTATVFGSTAPPSGAAGTMVFVGLDVEAAPTLGGVYLAPLASDPPLTQLVAIGDPVPDFAGAPTADAFTAFGEGLSYDGRFVAFWGAWGAATRAVTLACPTDGEAAVVAACVAGSPALDGVYPVTVPAGQGVFVHDVRAGRTTMVARTGLHFADLLFWNFSGRPAGTGSGDETTLEPPRWRSNAFAAVSADGEGRFRVAFKALRADGSTGVYLNGGPEVREAGFKVLVDTRTSAWLLDRAAPPADAAGTLPLTVTGVGIERDAFRADGRSDDGVAYLVIDATMANADGSVSWGGIYLTRLRNDG